MFLRWSRLLARVVEILRLRCLESARHRVLRIIPVLESLIVLSLDLNLVLLLVVLAWELFDVWDHLTGLFIDGKDHWLSVTRWTKSLILLNLHNIRLFGVLYRCTNWSLLHLDHVGSSDTRDLSRLMLGLNSAVYLALDIELPLLLALIHKFWKVVNLLVNILRSTLFWVERMKKHLPLFRCFFIIRLLVVFVLIFVNALRVLPTL